MRNSFQSLWWYLRRGYLRQFLKCCPRPGYCMCCGMWAWLTNETPAYSAHDGAFICEGCAEENDLNTEAAWAEYYEGCL